jgi:hypothetical protein
LNDTAVAYPSNVHVVVLVILLKRFKKKLCNVQFYVLHTSGNENWSNAAQIIRGKCTYTVHSHTIPSPIMEIPYSYKFAMICMFSDALTLCIPV